ncbi:MAG: MarR family transcriptional regulator [Alphaproteobacteria bacterium]|nr:MarR family transcriptional regulator [Pseudomonadota bacterium]
MIYHVHRKPVQADPSGETANFVIEQNLGHLVALTARLFARTLQVRFADFGVAVGQWPILMFLWEEDELSQRELSRRIQIEEPTAARTLARMERDGLVRRARNARDRREIRVSLTDKGNALRDELIPCAQEVNARATHGLSEADKARLASLLQYMIARLG